MKKYIVKDMENRRYHNIFGTTDYDIPMFSMKSALFICFVTIASFFMNILICQFMNIDYRILTAIMTGIVSGFSVAIAQYFFEKKEGYCKQFWVTGCILSVICMCVIFVSIT